MSVTIEQIIAYVAESHGLCVADLKGQRRTRYRARPRQMAMALCRAMTSRSLPDIGRHFGGRDHTTVLHAVRVVEKRRKCDPSYNDRFLSAVAVLKETPPVQNAWPVNVLTLTRAELLMLGDFGTQLVKMLSELRQSPNTHIVSPVRRRPIRYAPQYLGSDLAASPVERMMGGRA